MSLPGIEKRDLLQTLVSAEAPRPVPAVRVRVRFAPAGWALPPPSGIIHTVRYSDPAMASYSTNEFRSGLKILLAGDPCVIVDNEFVKPGKGQAFNRVRIRNLKTGKTVDKTFRSGDSVESADVMDIAMQYLYTDGEFWHFMVPDTFEQYAADAAAIGDAKDWLSDGDLCEITLWNNAPLIVQPPNFVELAIAETDPGVKGDTASGGGKPARLATGAVVRVPLFIDQGEVIRVDTRSREYVSRVK